MYEDNAKTESLVRGQVTFKYLVDQIEISRLIPNLVNSYANATSYYEDEFNKLEKPLLEVLEKLAKQRDVCYNTVGAFDKFFPNG